MEPLLGDALSQPPPERVDVATVKFKACEVASNTRKGLGDGAPPPCTAWKVKPVCVNTVPVSAATAVTKNFPAQHAGTFSTVWNAPGVTGKGDDEGWPVEAAFTNACRGTPGPTSES